MWSVALNEGGGRLKHTLRGCDNSHGHLTCLSSESLQPSILITEPGDVLGIVRQRSKCLTVLFFVKAHS